MGVREALNRNPKIMGIAGTVAVAVAIWVVYRTVTDQGLKVKQPTQYYFTTDDGKTLFAAPKTSVPPFEKDGKQAVLAHVFTCDKGKTQFVAYLVKYKDEFAKRAAAEAANAEQAGKAKANDGGALASAAAAFSMLVKKPGDPEWVPFTSPKGSSVTGIWCPSRDPWDLVEKYPD